MSIRVAVDAMGGDQAPAVVVEGAVAACRSMPDDLEVLLFGPEARLREELGRYEDVPALNLTVVDAPEVIGMAESPTAAVKSKPRSSIHLGLRAIKEGRADAFVSAGNTGAVMAAALFILGRLPNVARPTLLTLYPNLERKPAVVLDVGSNVDCKPEHLVQFAQMGAVYAERTLHRENPTVALLNIGEEPGKGNEQAKAAYKLLAETPGLRFRGNIEGRDLLTYVADVIVCDGFVGNIILKLGESVASVLPKLIGGEMQRQKLGPEEQALVARIVRGAFRSFDYEEFGGVPLLGVAGNVLVGHGGSTARAVTRMILAGGEAARQDVAGFIAAAFTG
ncbi:phosphate acyltransferase PlsX [Rhodocaloribacter sp.]